MARSGALQTIRRGADWVVIGLAVLIAAGVFLQVYLIGAYVFGAGSGALDAHQSIGFSVHGFEVLVLIAALIAWLGPLDLGLALLVAVLGTVQISLASAEKWAGGLHALGALVVLVLVTVLAARGLGRRRRPAVA